MKLALCSGGVFLSVLLTQQVSFAQVTTGTILGTVSDSAGAVMPGVTVTIKNIETGVSRTVQSDPAGRYRAPQLGLGGYEVIAEMDGFQTAVRTGINLTVGREALVDFTLEVGAVAERITVTGEAPLVETTNATVASLVDERSIKELPLVGRSLADLTALQPGVVLVTTIAPSSFIGGAARLSVHGARPQQSTYLLDGMEISAPRFNTVPSSVLGKQLGVEAIREYSILTKNYGAQYGRAVGGVVNAVTQSGTNAFHGNAFEYFRNNVFDAKNFFDDPQATKPIFISNQFGASLGGPIGRERTFFFMNYEGIRERKGVTDNITVVDALARQGIITDRNGNVTQQLTVPQYAVDWLNLTVCPSSKTGRIEPAQVNIPGLELCPSDYLEKLDGGLARYVGTRKRNATENYGMFRIDRTITDSDTLFGRVTIDRSERTQPLLKRKSGYRNVEEGKYYYLSVQETHIFSPSVLNTFRAGFNRNLMREEEIIPPGNNPQMSCYDESNLTDAHPLCNISIGGGAGITGSTLTPKFLYIGNTFDYTDAVNLNTGRHSMEFGVTVRRYQMNESQDTWISGDIAFASYANFLRGTADEIIAILPPTDLWRGYRQTYTSLYVQDDFRVLPTLTFNLGVRWERMTDPSEVNGKIGTVRDVLKDRNYTLGQLFDVDDRLRGFQPRFGFAWTPFGNQRSVLRGGFGMFEELPLSYHYSLTNYIPPFARRVTLLNPPFPKPLQNVAALAASEEPIINAFEWTTAYSMQWNIGLEHQISDSMVVSASYVGTSTRHLTGSYNPNVAVPQQDENGRWYHTAGDRIPNSAFFAVRYQGLVGDASYNGFTLSMERQASAGLQFRASYTFSKNLDNVGLGTQGAETADNTRQSNNTYDLKGERGLSNIHTANQAVLTMNYELPFGTGKPWANNLGGISNLLVGGWQLNGTTTVRDGLPLLVKLGFRNSPHRVASDRPDLVPGKSNNPVLGGPDKYYDPTAFVLPPLGTMTPAPAGRFYYGNVGRNTLVGPGLLSQNLSIFKNIPAGEGKRVQFRAELFNLFNHPNFGIPNMNVRLRGGAINPVAGRITSTSTDNRQIQFALKFEF